MNSDYHVYNAGRLISRGHGRHAERKISSWELIFVLSSTLDMFIGSDNYDVPAHHCLLLPPGIRHGGRAPYTANLSFFWIHFSPSNRKGYKLLSAMPRVFAVLNPARLSEYFQLFLSLQDEEPEDHSARDQIFELILHEANKKQRQILPDQVPPILVSKLENLLRLHFREPLTTRDLAQRLQCNQDYLGRLYQKYSQKTITAALNEIRLHHAAHLLQETTLSIAQIADEVGYNDPAYFRRRFFRQYAVSPHLYRKLRPQGHVNTE